MQRTYHFSEIGPTHAEGDIFARLVALGRRQKFSAGEQVLHQGDPGNGFWLIESGNVMACRFGKDGERILYGVLGRGDLVGELACFAGVTQQVHAIAESDATLVWIEMRQVDGLLGEGPQVARWLLQSLANKMRTALNRLEGDYSLSARARIARVLADLAKAEGPELDVTQQQLADFVGVSRVTVGQVLAELEQVGAVERSYRRITIVDPSRLDL